MSATSTRRGADVRVVREPSVYELGGPNSYFIDLVTARLQDDKQAQTRLERHSVEVRAGRGRALERRGHRSLEPAGTTYRYEARSTPENSYADPPVWFTELTATAPRPERVVSDLIGSMPLPRGVSSVNVPRITRGTTTNSQTPGTPVSDTDFQDAATGSQVITISGEADIPMQMLEQSPAGDGSVDQVLTRDLLADYDAKLEKNLIYGPGGTGPAARLLGLTNVAGTNQVTYADASPTATAMYQYFGQTFGAVSDARLLRPEGWLMRGGRFAWLASSEDASSRPLEVPLAAGGILSNPTLPNPVSGLLGLPVFTTEAIPTTLGTAANQDAIIAFRWSDSLLWESEPTISVFREVGSGTLEARIQIRVYAAAILSRYPSSIGVLGGTGLKVQTNE